MGGNASAKALRWHIDNQIFRVDEETGFIWRCKKYVRNRYDYWLLPCAPVRADIKESSNGYLRVFLAHQGSRFTIMAHRLVVILLNNELIEDGFVVDHRNRIRRDNRPSNLRVVTWKENNDFAHQARREAELREAKKLGLIL